MEVSKVAEEKLRNRVDESFFFEDARNFPFLALSDIKKKSLSIGIARNASSHGTKGKLFPCRSLLCSFSFIFHPSEANIMDDSLSREEGSMCLLLTASPTNTGPRRSGKRLAKKIEIARRLQVTSELLDGFDL